MRLCTTTPDTSPKAPDPVAIQYGYQRIIPWQAGAVAGTFVIDVLIGKRLPFYLPIISTTTTYLLRKYARFCVWGNTKLVANNKVYQMIEDRIHPLSSSTDCFKNQIPVFRKTGITHDFSKPYIKIYIPIKDVTTNEQKTLLNGSRRKYNVTCSMAVSHALDGAGLPHTPCPISISPTASLLYMSTFGQCSKRVERPELLNITPHGTISTIGVQVILEIVAPLYTLYNLAIGVQYLCKLKSTPNDLPIAQPVPVIPSLESKFYKTSSIVILGCASLLSVGKLVQFIKTKLEENRDWKPARPKPHNWVKKEGIEQQDQLAVL